MSKVRFNKLENSRSIKNDASVKVTQMGHIIEVIHTARDPHILDEYVKLNKSEYAVIDRETGEVMEIKDYILNENCSQNTAGIKKTMKKIRDIINNNFTGAKNELFITLTYDIERNGGKPQNDVEKASRDFEAFIKRFRRRYPDLEYIAILEPQGNTSWHWHVLTKFKKWDSKKQFYTPRPRRC